MVGRRAKPREHIARQAKYPVWAAKLRLAGAGQSCGLGHFPELSRLLSQNKPAVCRYMAG
jgi:hypothetical protein